MDKFMNDALENGRMANEQKEVPVGCVFVYRNEIIAYGANLVNKTKNATRHAEFICIDQVFDYCKQNQLAYSDVFQEISVIVTVEPCIMCAAALNQLKVKEIIFGCVNDRFGGTTVLNVFELLQSNVTLHGDVRADEAMELLKEFYKGENPSAPISKKRKS
ncbi:tRNA-specific adenosine deaminase 2 [Sitodiplosis mosellana]|uniref:tRNA-specific adenosine deaminase 2 n=1 Tax=Sitodiplosis mosellana TaxID=263140 RepID=UPI002444359C|nr:tRNA-specific adenosine deaminase 2 [Sitodiplosis mosellana]